LYSAVMSLLQRRWRKVVCISYVLEKKDMTLA